MNLLVVQILGNGTTMTNIVQSGDPLTIGYFDNLDNESLNKYKKKSEK
jgi:hypothetical protein